MLSFVKSDNCHYCQSCDEAASQRPALRAAMSAASGPDAETMGRRQRKKLTTRQALRDTALGMFAERGFAATTVADICEAVDVSERTFFRYFASKEDVLLSDLAELLADAAAAVAGRPADEAPLDAILAGLDAAVRPRPRPAGPLPLLLAAQLRELPQETPGRLLRLFAQWQHTLSDALLQRAGLDPADAPDDARLRCDIAAGAAGVAVRRAFQALRRFPDSRRTKGAYRALLAEVFRLLAAGCPGPQQQAPDVGPAED